MGQKIQKLTEEECSELNNGSRGTTTSQTSIEWLIEEMLSKGFFKESVTLTNIDHLQYKAEEMHYKELMDSMQRGMELQEKENNRIGFREINGLLPKQETLYTEEQVREAIDMADKYDYLLVSEKTEIIQSLKQPKKD